MAQLNSGLLSKARVISAQTVWLLQLPVGVVMMIVLTGNLLLLSIPIGLGLLTLASALIAGALGGRAARRAMTEGCMSALVQLGLGSLQFAMAAPQIAFNLVFPLLLGVMIWMATAIMAVDELAAMKPAFSR